MARRHTLTISDMITRSGQSAWWEPIVPQTCRAWPSSRQFRFRVGTPRYIRRVPDDETSLPPMIEVRPGYFRASWPMAAAAVILDEEDRVLLVRPAYHSGRW